MGRKRASDLVTAEEVACFAYCPEQWRLQHRLGFHSANQEALNAGVRHHTRKAVAERLAVGSMMLGRVLVVIALLVLALLSLLWVFGR
jgi:hypothetical protein